MLELILFFVLALIASWVLIRGTVFWIKYSEEWIRNSRWPSVFPRLVDCPRCERPIGRLARSRSFREVLLGGWTCPKCGSEFDQLDNIRIARAWNAHLRDFEQRSLNEAAVRDRNDKRSPVERLFEEDE